MLSSYNLIFTLISIFFNFMNSWILSFCSTLGFIIENFLLVFEKRRVIIMVIVKENEKERIIRDIIIVIFF